jgi:hypothetical protein
MIFGRLFVCFILVISLKDYRKINSVATVFLGQMLDWLDCWYNIMWSSLSVTCCRLVVFFGTPVSSTNKTDHDITENNWNIVESGAKHYNPNPSFYDKKKS